MRLLKMGVGKYNFKKSYTMKIPIRPDWLESDSFRDKCNMLILDKKKGCFCEKNFKEIINYINPGDIICFNDSCIINNMIICESTTNNLIKFVVEGFLPENRVIISSLLNDKLCPGDVFSLVDNDDISICIEGEFDSSPRNRYQAALKNLNDLVNYLAGNGERLDEYVDSSFFYKNPKAYQSVVSRKKGSLEIPSAGMHFTSELISKIKGKGGVITFITLHVASTEISPHIDNVDNAKINKEYFEVTQETADAINYAKKTGSKVFAIGTTVARALESSYSFDSGLVRECFGWTDLYINQDYTIKVADCFLTNLHQPETTHMELTGQFAGADLLMKVYSSKEIQTCRFDMFGDCMLVL